jgi:hypothetical protein
MSWARGFEAGSRVAGDVLDTYRQAGLRRGLADESRKYNITEGAFGPELQENIRQVEQLREQALRDAAANSGTVADLETIRAQYDPSIRELQRRAEMTAPDFTVASRAMRSEDTFGTREEATRAARPMRAEGLASVYERFGDIDKAEDLRERADTGRFRELQMRGLERTERQASTVEAVDADMSKWMNNRLTDSEGNPRAPTLEDTVAGIQHRASLLQERGLGDQAASAFQQYLSIAANQIQTQTLERNQALGSVAAGIAAGDFGPVQEFYDRFIPDGAKVTDVKEGRDGRITINRTTLDGEKLPATTFANRNEMLAALNSIREPMSLYNYSQQEFQNTIARERLVLERARTLRERDRFIEVEDARGNLRVINVATLPLGKDGQPVMPEGMRRKGAGTRELTDFEKEQLKAYNKWLEDSRNARAPQADKDAKLRELGIPNIFDGRGASQTGVRDWDDTGEEQPAEPVAEATDEPATIQPRTAMTRGEARQNARVRAELNQQFEALPEVQAMIQQLESTRAGLRRGGRDDTRALSAQLAQMREQFIAERMGLR